MLFNSIDFGIFLPVVFAIYWLIKSHNTRLQNTFLLIASYLFYGWWDWRFLILIFVSSLIDFSIGLKIGKTIEKNYRKILLLISLSVNIGFLLYFKYSNFFLENFYEVFTVFGLKFNYHTLKVILPVGISFYTFQTLSYTIDIYRGNLKPTNDFISFSAFVSFFPQLVAGPIERANNLLPQFFVKRKFSYQDSIDGLRQILWGFFKKVVVADNCAEYANIIFNNSELYGGSTLFLGALFFTFQIYGDFSGYSDIAIGTARLFGFNLMKNFAFPYFSRDIAEFWRRWHISLSTWFRDYLYIPLGGSRGGTFQKIRNIFVIFLVSGFWHGANWTFIVWGALNAIYFLPIMLVKRNRQNLDIVAQNSLFPSFVDFFKIFSTFSLTVIAWVFFRANSLSHAFEILFEITSRTLFTIPSFSNRKDAFEVLLLIAVFVVIEWFGRRDDYAIQNYFTKSPISRYIFYFLILSIIWIYGQWNLNEFIYFQF